MKASHSTISLFASAALFTFTSLSAVETDPVGYVTETIKAQTFNLFGLNLSSPIVTSGSLESASGTTLTDAHADFTSTLAGGSEYFIKITSGDSELGLNTGVIAGSATTLTTDDDISSVISAGTTYEIRKVLTVADIFGSNNSVELKGATAGDRSNADIIWIPDGLGGYTRVYYNATARTFPPLSVGWKTTSGADANAASTPIYFTSGVLIQVQRTAFDLNEAGVDSEDLTTKDIVIAGSVQLENTQMILEPGFNFISRVFPGDITLGESDLEFDIAQAAAGDLSNADIIWVPDGAGGYSRYYYNGTARIFPPLSIGWKRTSAGDSDVSGATISSGFIIERKGVAKMITMKIPDSVTL